MFIYSVRASSVKFFAAVVLTVAVFLIIVFAGGGISAEASADQIDLSGIKTEEDRVAFIEKFGIKVDGGSVETVDFVMPENFDRVMLGYNEIQKAQGLNLSSYAKKRVTRYTYSVTNYDSYDGKVQANLLIYRNRVIGCDISSADPEGFVEPLIK